jgi:hypothetical protein
VTVKTASVGDPDGGVRLNATALERIDLGMQSCAHSCVDMRGERLTLRGGGADALEMFTVLERLRQQKERCEAEAAVKEIGGEPLEGSGFEGEPSSE